MSNNNIPVVTDLVSPGNPELKVKANSSASDTLNIDELNMRIDELENAIGQDSSHGSIGRAYAIRAETANQ